MENTLTELKEIEEVVKKIGNEIIVKKVEHKIYREMRNAKLRGEVKHTLIGRWQYIYKSQKGEISLVKLISYYHDGVDLWEIYCLKGNLFDDIERFDTKKEAEIRIRELLK